MSHPLTDEVCRHLADTEDRPFTSIEMDNMRAAADWQLEQDAEELENILLEIILPPAVDLIVERFKRTMRPTTQKDNQ